MNSIRDCYVLSDQVIGLLILMTTDNTSEHYSTSTSDIVKNSLFPVNKQNMTFSVKVHHFN